MKQKGCVEIAHCGIHLLSVTPFSDLGDDMMRTCILLHMPVNLGLQCWALGRV